jgi:hypothetical protein
VSKTDIPLKRSQMPQDRSHLRNVASINKRNVAPNRLLERLRAIPFWRYFLGILIRIVAHS